jgi:hypothetical protein
VGNPFSSDLTAVLSFTTSLRSLKLHHFGITVQGSAAEQFCRGLSAVNISSLSLAHSRLTDAAVQAIVAALTNKKKKSSLTALDLSSCYLSPRSVLRVAEAIKLNRTLTELDLSNNGLNNQTGRYIAEALVFNMTIRILSLQSNELGDKFCQDFAKAIRRNVVLSECDLSCNSFGNIGAQALHSVIGSANKTLTSLGDLTKNTSLSVKVREELKSQTSVRDYELLAPVEETNPDTFEVFAWNLTDSVLT